jgi:nicotinamide mononucleotide (NMN) deamidase PncC
VGTVWFGLAKLNGDISTHHKLFSGNRDEIRAASVTFALTLLLEAAGR